MALKPALSINEQLELLRKRGMNIDDENKAKTFLNENHYYRLNIYFHKFMDAPDHYQKEVRFSQIMAVHENDRWLRNKILSMLEPIEIGARTQISHHLAMKYGSDAFYNNSIFKDPIKFGDICRIFTNEINRNQNDPVVVHHRTRYAGRFPIWVVVELFSFNTLSKLFNNLLEPDKKAIANGFYNINDHLFGQWLHVLSIQRNICAHYGYLFRREYPIRPIIERSSNWDPTQDNKLFALFLAIRRLSNPIIWQGFIKTISDNEKASPFFCLSDYGFPSDWQTYLN